jgi:hypothetical protein
MVEKILTPVETKAALKNKLAVEKFFLIDPDPALTLYKISKFALANPEQYKIFKVMLDKEVLKIQKAKK